MGLIHCPPTRSASPKRLSAVFDGGGPPGGRGPEGGIGVEVIGWISAKGSKDAAGVCTYEYLWYEYLWTCGFSVSTKVCVRHVTVSFVIPTHVFTTTVDMNLIFV